MLFIISGVDPASDKQTITDAYREMTLKYRREFEFVYPLSVFLNEAHFYSLIILDPDKGPQNNEEIGERFKMIEEAADHLLSKFDEDGDSYGKDDEDIEEEVSCVIS